MFLRGNIIDIGFIDVFVIIYGGKLHGIINDKRNGEEMGNIKEKSNYSLLTRTYRRSDS